MGSLQQLRLQVLSNEQKKRVWAFARDRRLASMGVKRRRPMADIRQCIITSCSKEARLLGIEAGMRYEEAKSKLPDMKIIVIGGQYDQANQ